MNFIELHYKGVPRSMNVLNISAVAPRESHPGSIVWISGDPEAFTVDESYEEVMGMIHSMDGIPEVEA